MKVQLSFEEKSIIQNDFKQIKNKEDLLALINKVNLFIYKKNAINFNLQTLTYYINPNFSKHRFKAFSIQKKSGELRVIHAPQKIFKHLLKCCKFIFETIFQPSSVVTGFVAGKSILDNAQIHVNKNYIYNIDLKDFFFSFDRNTVKLSLMNAPFSLNKEREPLAFLLSSLFTHEILINGEKQFVLTQGSPISPILTNIICKDLDRRLLGLAKRFHCKYSRYADDITFSCDRNIFSDIVFQEELKRIIQANKLEINEKKTRLETKSYTQLVTGLVVNEKVNIKSSLIKEVRMWIYYLEKYNIEKVLALYNKDYNTNIKDINNIFRILLGKISYIGMVKGKDNNSYKQLKSRFYKILKSEKDTSISKNIQSNNILANDFVGLENTNKSIIANNITAALENINKNLPTNNIAAILENINKSLPANYIAIILEIINKSLPTNNIVTVLKNIIKSLPANLITKSIYIDINKLLLTIPNKHKKYHSPKEMIIFLSKFSFNSDEKFKWFTHNPDFEFDKDFYNQKLKGINKAINEIGTWNLNFSTLNYVKDFFNKEDNYLIDYANGYISPYTYASPFILEKINEGENPFKIRIENTYFESIITTFKYHLVFRLDNEKFLFLSTFQDFLLERLSIDFDYDFNDDFLEIAQQLFAYIDVNNFYRGLDRIISNINSRKAYSTNIDFKLQENSDYYTLSIIHLDIKIDVNEKLFTEQEEKVIQKYWFSIVDFSVEYSTKDNKSFNVSYLSNSSSLSNSLVSNSIITNVDMLFKNIYYIIKIFK